MSAEQRDPIPFRGDVVITTARGEVRIPSNVIHMEGIDVDLFRREVVVKFLASGVRLEKPEDDPI